MVTRSTFCLIAASWLLPLTLHAEPLTPLRMALDDTLVVCPHYPALVSADRAALATLYAPHEFQPLWNKPERLLDALAALADDGLDPRDYHLDELRRLRQSSKKSPGAGPCADLLASQAYLGALDHLYRGRLPQADWQPLWRQRPAELQARLASLAQAHLSDPAQAFARARPQDQRYVQLRRAYAAQRKAPLPAWQPLAEGPLLRPGQRDPRVPALAERLSQAGYLNGTPAGVEDHYSPALAQALAHFQERHGIKPDGILGPATLRELNISPATRLAQLRVNLERLRWIAHDIEPDMLLVDIAGARLLLYRDGEPHWQTRTQVGRAARPTPELKSTISHLTLNPTWTIPPTILREDKLPEIRRDPGYLASHELQVLDYQGQPLDPLSIDWDNPGPILLRQAAGPSNPLGKVAIRFANPFSVYLHDTPSQQLFSDAQRTFSSGCVRVEGALTLVDLLLSESEKQPFADRLASGETRRFDLARRLPILLAYWTAEADANGLVTYRPDVYARDAALIGAFHRLDGAHLQSAAQ